MKSLDFYENYVTLFCQKKKLFDNIIFRGGQRYFFGGCAFARMLPFFSCLLALDRNDFKFASALGAIPL
jgi:hypothetical protein